MPPTTARRCPFRPGNSTVRLRTSNREAAGTVSPSTRMPSLGPQRGHGASGGGKTFEPVWHHMIVGSVVERQHRELLGVDALHVSPDFRLLLAVELGFRLGGIAFRGGRPGRGLSRRPDP